MSGPIVRTGTTPKFWENWDRVFGEKKTAAGKKSKSAGRKKASAKAASKKSPKKSAGKKAAARKKTRK